MIELSPSLLPPHPPFNNDLTNCCKLYDQLIVSVRHKNVNSTITQSPIELQQCVDRQAGLLYDKTMALAAYT